MSRASFVISRLFVLFLSLTFAGLTPSFVLAQNVEQNINVNSLVQKATLSLSPRTGSFQEGSVFSLPIFIDTQGAGVNTISLSVKFDPTKLSIIDPVGNTSLITLWVSPPTYSNVNGTMKLVGVIPGGITTSRGLIVTITFKALASGDTRVTISPDSQILANDGLGTAVQSNFGSGLYTITLKPPEGVRVFSDSHPFQDHWYNNNNVVISWEKPVGVTSFSYVVDDLPSTVPDNASDTSDTTTSFPNSKEGLMYFHIKAEKGGVWGGTTDFLVRIDVSPPAQFTPVVDIYSDSSINKKALLSFFTTDSLSGVDHYEVGVIDKKDSANISPAFVTVDSPYQLPIQSSGDLHVIVRAIDRAGNARDESIDVNLAPSINDIIRNNIAIVLLAGLILILLIWFLLHFLFGHSTFRDAYRVVQSTRNREKEEHKHQFLIDQLENENTPLHVIDPPKVERSPLFKTFAPLPKMAPREENPRRVIPIIAVPTLPPITGLRPSVSQSFADLPKMTGRPENIIPKIPVVEKVQEIPNPNDPSIKPLRTYMSDSQEIKQNQIPAPQQPTVESQKTPQPATPTQNPQTPPLTRPTYSAPPNSFFP